MADYPIPANEAERLEAVRRYAVLDTPSEAPFERVVRLVARLFRAPIAMVTVIDRDRQWFKACVGTDLRENSRALSFCTYAILADEVMVVPDASLDPRFAGNPVVTELGIRFYAGAPLRTAAGLNVGTLCLYDVVPRPDLRPDERETLTDLAASVMDDLEARLSATKATEAEAEVRLLNAQLERRVEARTSELEVQKAELEARNAEQETFAYTVSHDLRAPLLSIQGMTELLSEAVRDGDPEETAFLLGRITGNVERMGQLLSDLLALSRVGRAPEAAEVLDLGEAVDAALAGLGARLRGSELTLPPVWPRVRYPRSELDQVLVNLLGNAAKFAGRRDPAEPPRLALAWEEAPDTVTLRVSDNGPGVAEPYRDQVFGLFKKLDPKAEGTGVGLAIVKRVVERHGGRVWVEDSPPPPEGLGGATFAVTLPLAGQPATADAGR